MAVLSIRHSIFLFTLFADRAFSATPPLGSSGSPNNLNPQIAPPPKAGQPPSQWIESLFAPTALVSEQDELDAQNNSTGPVEDPQLTKRNYTETDGIITSKWTNDTDNSSYEIRLGLKCKTGVNYSTDIGAYTYTDGRTTNNTSFQDMVEDLYTLHQSTLDYRTRSYTQIVNTRYANHTLALARLAMKEANQALLVLLCRNATAATVTAPGYDFYETPLVSQSLQKLGKRQGAGAYWLAVLGASVGGGGIAAAAAAIIGAALHDNVTEYNLIQTGVIVAGTGLLAGTLYRCHAVGRLDNTANRIDRRIGQPAAGVAAAAAAVVPNPVQVLERVAPGGREAVAQNVFIAWFRKNLQRIVRGAVEDAMEDALSDIASEMFGTPQATTDSDTYYSANGDVESCLSVEDASRAAGDLQNLASQELELVPLQQMEDSLNEERPVGTGGQCVVQ